MPESAKRAIIQTATLDFASISANADDEEVVTVVGVGQHALEVVAVSAPSLEAGLVATGFVSDVDEVTVRVSNVTGSPVDPASQDFQIAVFHG